METDWQPYLIAGQDARPPALHLLKRFVIFRARAGIGRLAPKLSYVTPIGELVTLISAMRRATSQVLPKADQLQLWSFIRYDMTDVQRDAHERLSAEVRSKPVAVTADIAVPLETLFTSSVFLESMSTSRDVVLQLSLFINLMVDCVCRPGELALTTTPDAPTHSLQWRDMVIYGCRDKTGQVELFGKTTLRWLKGGRHDQGKFKTIPLTLLAPDKVRYDALRQIMVLGIIDGILSSWEVLEIVVRSEPKVVTRIPMVAAALNTPVFQIFGNGRVTTMPQDTGWFNESLKRLGQISGFTDSVTSYCLRRDAAYQIDQQRDASTRNFLLGHVDQSKMYYHRYQSKTAPLDVGETFWDAPLQSGAQMEFLIGMAPDRVQGTPVQVSKAGLQSCYAHPEVIASKIELDRARARLRAGHP